MAHRHDGVRNLLTSLIGKVCTNVEVQPQLQPLDNERFSLRSTVRSPEARLDFRAGGFQSRGVTAFFDVRVTHVNSKCTQGKTTSTIFKEPRRRKSGSNNRGCWTLKWDLSLPQLLEVTVRWQATATAFSNSYPRSSQKRMRNLITLLSLGLEHCFLLKIFRSVHTCVRCSGKPFHKIPQGDFINVYRLNASKACVRSFQRVMVAWACKLVFQGLFFFFFF